MPKRTLAASLLLCAACAGAPTAAEDPLPRGTRLLGMDVTQPEGAPFEACFEMARAAGAEAIQLPIMWDDCEKSPGVFTPDPDWLAIADAYYGPRQVPVHLVLVPIDTNNRRVPADLASVPFDDPRMIERFGAWLDWALGRVPAVKLVSLSIGNEVDALLAGEADWAAYGVFFEAARERARRVRPGCPVGVKMTWGGLTAPPGAEFARRLNRSSDGVFATYYAIGPDFRVKSAEQAVGDLTALVDAYPDRGIWLLEIGCPSSLRIGGSEELQARFVRDVFALWDRRAASIPALHWTWMHDIPATAVESYGRYYRLADEGFLAYLGSLGLRTGEGQGRDKAAFRALREEAARRGWGGPR